MDNSLDIGYQKAYKTMALLAEIRAEQRCMIRETRRARKSLERQPPRSLLARLFKTINKRA